MSAYLSRTAALLALATATGHPAFANDAKIAVHDQRVESGNIVKVQDVTSPSAGFLVIHATEPAKTEIPGPAIGYAIVNPGSNSNVSVKLEQDVRAGEKLTAVLHEDAKADGMFDEALDKPVAKPDGATVMAGFVTK
ncbi:MAG: hypothetical protein Q7T86_06330 [Hyphomicrobiaceae bacterium]|nr:hypothetical protein [Hyphomicrobiaceae bacterium]